MSDNQKEWKESEVEKWTFSFAPIPLRYVCVLFSVGSRTKNIRSDARQRFHICQVDLIELKLKGAI